MTESLNCYQIRLLRTAIEYFIDAKQDEIEYDWVCLLYTSPSPRDGLLSRMPSSA